MVWEISKKFRFEAAHVLEHHAGKCSRLHGHSWVGVVTCRGYLLRTSGSRTNMVLDFADLSAVIDPLVEEYLDHHHLNATLEEASPTSEFVARWLWDAILECPRTPKILAMGLHSVRIEETCTCACTYYGSRRPAHVRAPTTDQNND